VVVVAQVELVVAALVDNRVLVEPQEQMDLAVAVAGLVRVLLMLAQVVAV
jgi:hypothetical protein